MINQLKLNSFKNFSNVEIPISPVTLLTGENNTGKTTILRSFLELERANVDSPNPQVHLDYAEVKFPDIDIELRGNDMNLYCFNFVWANIPNGDTLTHEIKMLNNGAYKLHDLAGDSFKSLSGELSKASEKVLYMYAKLQHLSPRCTVLIENPELYLHDAAQAKVVDYLASLASKGIQIILETQSEHILNQWLVSCNRGIITPENLGVLFLENLGIKKIQVEEGGRIRYTPYKFFNQHTIAYEQLMGF